MIPARKQKQAESGTHSGQHWEGKQGGLKETKKKKRTTKVPEGMRRGERDSGRGENGGQEGGNPTRKLIETEPDTRGKKSQNGVTFHYSRKTRDEKRRSVDIVGGLGKKVCRNRV